MLKEFLSKLLITFFSKNIYTYNFGGFISIIIYFQKMFDLPIFVKTW